MTRLGLVVAAWALMSCGDARNDGIGGQVTGLLLGSDAEAPARQSLNVTEEDLLGNPGTYMRVNIRDRNRWETMVRAGSNGARTTWIDGENITVTEENGIVVATRGLPRDMMGAEATGTWNAIRAGGGTVQRQVDFLDDQDQILARVLQCRIVSEGSDPVTRLQRTYPASRFKEECSGEGLSLSNIYWLNPSGRMIRSLQAVSPDAGYLQIDVF
ncbi:YjbF family lipoprotein [Loktanella sp. Alg231-35]|uniref:YjbF family lipoprotein n=1 Tax=Loktanella sp. Alg231-35 TaxID=1922220 RepID=UPI00131F3DFE|nr:YjbF family lipoprotein [Loktanella sp. Alg231-35]